MFKLFTFIFYARAFVFSVISIYLFLFFFFFSSRRRHTRCSRDWSSDVCSSDLLGRESLGRARKRLRSLLEGRAPAPTVNHGRFIAPAGGDHLPVHGHSQGV